MELGGNIELINFDDLEVSKLIVVKKMVGNLTKEITDSNKNFEKIKVALTDPKKVEIQVNLTIKGKTKTVTETAENIFFCLDKVFKKLK